MSRKFLTHIDLARNEIQNAVAQVLAADPGTAVPGQFYYNSTTQRVMFRTATEFIDYSLRANHSGTQTAATISDFASQVQATRLDQLAAPTSPVSVNGQRVLNVGDPTAGTDAVNKIYVDNAVNGTDWKQSVRAATTANVDPVFGPQTIDGVSLVAGDRVLLKDQGLIAQNGIWVVDAGFWARAVDADSSATLNTGMSTFVEEGTVNANTQWRLTTISPIVIDTTNLVFAQIGAGSSYTAGSGIVVSGSVLSVDSAVVVRKFSSFVGDGVSGVIPINHGLATLDVMVQVYEVATGETVECDVARTTTNQVSLGFASPPAWEALRVIIQA